MIIANFMDSSLLDLKRKGVFRTIPETYNPGGAYERVIHYTPHARDVEVADTLSEYRIDLRVHNVSGIQPLKFVRVVAAVWQELGRNKVDLVRGRLPYIGSLIGAIAARLRGLPFVVSLGGDNRISQAGDGFLYGSKDLSYAMENAVLRLATRIIVPNLYTRAYVESIIGANAARKRCVVIGWISQPVSDRDDGDDERLAGLGLPLDQPLLPVIGFVNRYKYSHVLFDMLDAGPLIDRSSRKAIVCFVGDGPLRAEGECRFSHRADVRFFGWQQKDVVQSLLRKAAAVVIPMSGFVLLEAASLGKPVISSLVEWHGELVESGRSGLLVNPDCAQEWRDAIGRLLADPVDASAMGARLKSVYWERFSPDRCRAAEYRLYEELTGKQVRA